MKKSKRQNKNRKNLVRKKLVLVEHRGEDFPDEGKKLVLVEHYGEDVPYIDDLIKSGDLVLLAADSSFSLFDATKRGYEELRKRLPPGNAITTEVEDGKYISQSGHAVYVLKGKVVDEREFIRQWLGKDCCFYELDEDEKDTIPSF